MYQLLRILSEARRAGAGESDVVGVEFKTQTFPKGCGQVLEELGRNLPRTAADVAGDVSVTAADEVIHRGAVSGVSVLTES